MEMKWYTIFTNPNCENKVAAILSRKQITYFCPLNLISKKESSAKNYEAFSGYIFVNILESQITAIKKITGIKNFMYWMNTPAIISEPEINLIADFLGEHNQVKLEKREIGFTNEVYYDISPKENQAKLIHLNNNKVKAALPSLGYMMTAEIERSSVHLLVNKDIISHSNSKFRFLYKMAK